MKVNPPADADKPVPIVNDNTCYLATASNMLAGAGYGTGATVQARAADIYAEMIAQFGTANGGWTDAALSWWLGSANNTWTTNPYTVVTVYGNKSPKYPWANSNGAQDIANNLRECNFVGLSISWPTNASGVIGSGGHAITSWGDGGWAPWRDYNDPLTGNPGNVRVTDSDTDAGGDVQQYDYDGYTSPNPGGANEGNGWYIDYSSNHPYIKHIVTLTPAATASGGAGIQRVIGAYRVHQGLQRAATDLSYRVGTDADILSYLTRVSWTTTATPAIVEQTPNRRHLDVVWDFTENPVPADQWITITTEFILRNWNAIWYDDVAFSYAAESIVAAPAVRWRLITPEVPQATRIANVTGGYVVAGFEVIDPEATGSGRLIGEYRLVHQYLFNQSPEQHVLQLTGRSGRAITRLRIGHSYGLPSDDALWRFDGWLTDRGAEEFPLGTQPLEIAIDWAGRLPYPEGELIEKRIDDIKQGLDDTLPPRRR